MTTAQIIAPMILHGILAILGCFASIGAEALRGFTIHDADDPNSELQRPASASGRASFLVLYMLPPFTMGCVFGLLFIGGLNSYLNEPLSYAVTIILGAVANTFVLKLNDMSPQQIISLLRNSFRIR